MWGLLISAVCNCLIFVVDAFLPPASESAQTLLLYQLPQPALGDMVSALQILGLFIDLPVLFICLAVIFGWRTVWLGVRVYRIVLELIPMLG